MTPKRIQLKRTRGWRKPENTVVVSRPSKWGNPFTIAFARECHPKEAETQLARRCVRAYEAIFDEADKVRIREELRGKNLACWCKLSEPCHADILLEIANTEQRRCSAAHKQHNTNSKGTTQ